MKASIQLGGRIHFGVILRSAFVTAEEMTLVVQQGMERVVSSHWLWAVIIGCNCNRSANKSNHQIQNLLLFVTQSRHTWQYRTYSLLLKKQSYTYKVKKKIQLTIAPTKTETVSLRKPIYNVTYFRKYYGYTQLQELRYLIYTDWAIAACRRSSCQL
jgi:hypothetical protein